MKKKTVLSIPTRILLVISSILITIMISASIITYFFTYNNMLTTNRLSMTVVASEIYQNFQNMIKIQTNDIDKMSKDNDFINLVNIKNLNSREDFQRKYSDDITNINGKLKGYITDINSEEDIYITDKSGIIIADSSNDYINNDYSNYSYTKDALQGKQTMSDVYISTISAKPVVTFVQALKDVNGNIIGTIGKSIYTDYFSQRFDKFKYLNSGFIFIVDNSKNYIYHPVKYNINKKIDISVIANLLKNEVIYNKQNSGYLVYDKGKERFEANYISIPELKSVIVLSVNENDIKSSAEIVGEIIGFATLLALLIMIPTCYFVIKSILRPLNKLSSDALIISKGDLTMQKHLYKNDEIGVLAESFNVMVENIKRLLTNIKKVSDELFDMNSFIKTSQEESNRGMNIVNSDSSKLVEATEKLEIIVKFSYQSLTNIQDKIELISKQSGEMLSRANKIKSINEKGTVTVNTLKSVNQQSVNRLQIVNSSFNELDSNLNAIKDIVKLVTNISTQTNILSFNAAIEAARVGEAGAGFSVVANEIKKLSNTITEQMENIGGIVININKTMTDTQDSITKINDVSFIQVEAVDNTIENYNQILNEAADILHSIKNVDSSIESLNNDNNNIVKTLSEVQSISANFSSITNDINNVIGNQYNKTYEMDKLIVELEETITSLHKSMSIFKI